VAAQKTNAEYSARTQRRLITAARKEFAKVGYVAASTERIVVAAKLTRGALYYHYKDKQELFEAVFAELEREIAERINRSSARKRNPFDAVVAGCDAWLDACLDAEVRRIVLLDAPAVLGWKRWLEIDAECGAGLLHEGIEACLAAGVFVDVDATTLTHLLSGGMNEVGLFLAQSADAPAARRAAGRTLHALLEGLRRTAVSPGATDPS